MEHLKELSSLEKRLECRLGEQWMWVLEEAPEPGQNRSPVAELWVVHRWEAEEPLGKVQGQWSVVVVE